MGLGTFLILYLFVHDVYNTKCDLDTQIRQQSEKCAKEYTKNRCSPDQRLEAAFSFCEQQEICKNRQSSGFLEAFIHYGTTRWNQLCE